MPDFLAGTNNAAQIGYSVGRASGKGLRGQSFKNFPVPNLQLALYQLQIRGAGSGGSLVDSYIFPLSPESVRKEFNALTNFYDVQGDPTNLGVQRVIDVYGHTPVIYTVEGTTGWQLHQTDGYKFTGLQSVSRIESLLATWAQLNQIQINNGDPKLYELWFLDYFRNDFWAVVPSGPQGIRQHVGRPLLVNYSFRLVGFRNLNAPPAPGGDVIADTLATSDTQAVVNMITNSNSFTSTYSGVTSVAS